MIHNIASYKFTPLTDLAAFREQLLDQCLALGLRGTILLSQEGINLSLAGLEAAILQFKALLEQDLRFKGMSYRESLSEMMPFKRMKVKLKKEIITMRKPEASPSSVRAPSLTPTEFKRWLDENRDIAILDTRNEYEVEFGTFNNAVSLQINDFSEFPEKAEQLAKDKPIVMFCTGGIRCEKAGAHLLNSGFKNVFQLEGGILNYFSEVGGEHYNGDCFVFDGRVALDSKLNASGVVQCCICQRPIKAEHICDRSIN